jgi:hypothetical protein
MLAFSLINTFNIVTIINIITYFIVMGMKVFKEIFLPFNLALIQISDPSVRTPLRNMLLD